MSEQKTPVQIAKEALANLTEAELSEVQAEADVRKLKVNLITIDENGIIEYVNTTTQPNTKFDAAKGKLLQNRRRYEAAIRIRIKSFTNIPEGGTPTENALLTIVPYVFNMLGNWGYRLTDRNRNANPDNTVIINTFDLQKLPLDLEQ